MKTPVTFSNNIKPYTRTLLYYFITGIALYYCIKIQLYLRYTFALLRAVAVPWLNFGGGGGQKYEKHKNWLRRGGGHRPNCRPPGSATPSGKLFYFDISSANRRVYTKQNILLPMIPYNYRCVHAGPGKLKVHTMV